MLAAPLRRSWSSPLLTSLPRRRNVHVDDKRWPGWQVVIGIEVHAQIKSRHKLFSDSFTSDTAQSANTHVSPFDAAFPGTLPHINGKCVDLALRTALALESCVQHKSYFDRKHYFYSDLPSGYQITQRYSPIALGGSLTLPPPFSKSVGIVQIQLEQDTAKSMYDARRRVSHINLNRAGSGLMEIVSQPDMRSPEEAAAYVLALQSLLRSIGSSDGNMEQGSLRCDVNVSINKPNEPFGTRCEIKNLNSIRFMTIAIVSEIQRQIAFLNANPGSTVPQETRGFSEQRCETYRLRSKEDSPDYRYMPDPNLPPLVITESHLSRIRSTLPELPTVTRVRLQTQYGLVERDIDVLLSLESTRDIPCDGELESRHSGAVGYFETVCAGAGKGFEPIERNSRDPKIVINWITHELLGQLNIRQQPFKNNPVSAFQLGQLIDMVEMNILTRMSAKLLLRHMLDYPQEDKTPLEIAQSLNLMDQPTEKSPEEVMKELCMAVISEMPSEVSAVQAGNLNVLNKLIGRVAKSSRGRADPRLARKVLEELLK